MEENAERDYRHAKRESTLKHALYEGALLILPPTGTPRYATSTREYSPLALRGQPAWVLNCAPRRIICIYDPSKLACYSSQEGHPLLVLLRLSSEALLRARAPEARDQHGCPSPAPHVSIISNRASNSCPQAIQRIQSDSTVDSYDLTPMPPQSGQRARWTL